MPAKFKIGDRIVRNSKDVSGLILKIKDLDYLICYDDKSIGYHPIDYIDNMYELDYTIMIINKFNEDLKELLK